jgi:hypothetical protein
MIIAEQCWPATTFGLVRGDQGGRIDFEMALGLRMDIRGWLRALDPLCRAKQQSAALARRGALRFLEHCGHHATCHFKHHPHLPSNE